MSGSNALQITDPDASDNPLYAGTPAEGAALGSTVSTGVDRLSQWLAEMRVKHLWRQAGLSDGTYAEKLSDMPSGAARVPPDTLSDVSPFAEPASADTGTETTSPIYPSNPTQLDQRLMDQVLHGESFDYARAIQRAIENRQRLGRQ